MTIFQPDHFEQLGYVVLPRLCSLAQTVELIQVFDGKPGRAGRRDGLRMQAVRDIAASKEVVQVVSAVLGEHAFPVKATLFGKSNSTNWLVPWHQDLMIPVQAQGLAHGFTGRSIKSGIPHVRAPLHVLQSMLTIRLDLDGSTLENGPLRVLPGTHRSGFLSRGEISSFRSNRSPTTCLVPEGGALLMRPLLLHASSKSCSGANRRIVHLEFAAGDLREAFEWFDWNSPAGSSA